MPKILYSCIPFRPTSQARWWFGPLALIAAGWIAVPVLGASASAVANRSAGAGVAGHTFPGAGLAMSFESNQGQFADDIKFRSRGAGYSVVLRATDAVLVLGGDHARQRRELLMQRRSRANRGHRPEPPESTSESATVHLSMVGANPDVEVAGEARSPGIANYFFGSDPAHWHTAVPVFEKVRYRQIYPGIDLVYYGNQRQLEYDFIVAPGADPDVIRIRLEGVDRLSVEAGGDLIAHIGPRQVRWQKPRAYQEEGRNAHPVLAAFVVEAGDQFSFRLGPYDRARPLVIDPLLVYSSFLGGGDNDSVAAAAVDSAGNVILAGTTYSTNFPVFNAYRNTAPSRGTNADVFVTKLNSNGTALIFSTYFGGSAYDGANGLAVDASGNIYLVGSTESGDFPKSNNPFQSTKGNFVDAFLAKFGPSGTTLLYSTYYGDSGVAAGDAEEAFGVAVNNSGGAYLVGYTGSGSALKSKNPFQNGFGGGYTDALIAKFDTTLSGNNSLIWGSWLGGNFDEFGTAIALDSGGNVYVTGHMTMYCYDPMDFTPCPANFPIVNAFQPEFARGGDPDLLFADAFVTKISSANNPVNIFSTYLGGAGEDFGYGIAVDASDNFYIVGETSSADFPVLNAQQPVHADAGGFETDAFVTKFSSSGTSLLYSTFLGGRRSEGARSVVLDRFRNVYLVGYTFSTDFPVTPGAPQTESAGDISDVDLFLAKLNPAIPGPSSLVLGTYFGGLGDEASTAAFTSYSGVGLALDTNLNIYIGSDTQSTNLPVTSGVYQTTYRNNGDGFVAKISSPPDISVALLTSSTLVTVGSNLQYTIYANNNGPTTLSNVTVVDVLPTQLQYVSGSNNAGTVSHASGTVTWNFGVMTNGASGIGTLTVTTVQSGMITNTTTISAAPADVNTNNNVSRAVTRIRGIADLRLTMTEAPDPVDFSSNVVYAITITNAGPMPASSIIVSNPIPGAAKYVVADGGHPDFVYANIVHWFVTDLPAGRSTNVTLVLQATAPGTLLNSAQVSLYELDPVMADNSMTVPTTVKQMADLSLRSITDAPDPVFASSNLTYTIVVTNPGPTAADSVQVADELPAGFTFVTASPPGFSYSNGVVTCPLGNLSTGATATATITVKPLLDGLVMNIATAGSTAVDPVSTNNSRAVETTVLPLANLLVGISVLPATVVATSNLVYTIAVTNFGPTTASAVVVTNQLPAGMAFVSAQSSQGTCAQAGGIVTCDLGSLLLDGTATVTITATPMLAGLIGNTANVAAVTTDPVPGNNSATAQATVTQLADLSILSLTDAPDPVFASSNLIYTIIVTNPGPTTADSVQVVDALPAGFTFVSATASGGATQFQGVVTCHLGTLAVGSSKTATITAKPPLDGLVTNSATVSTSALDPVSANNSAAVETTVSPLANLAIGLAASPPSVVVTSNLVYTISVTNLGPTSASGVMVTNVLPGSMAFVSAQSSQGNCTQADGLVTCELGTLTNNGTATVAITATPVLAGVITNRATVAAAATDPVVGNNAATIQVTVTQMADLSILSLTDAPDPVFASSNLIYTIIVTNPGPTAANSVQTLDVLPASFTFVTATAPGPGGCFHSNGVVICDLGNLPIGATATNTITVRPSQEGLATNSATVSSMAFDSFTNNNTSAPVVTTVSPLANLTLGMTVSPSSVLVTSNLIYTISVTNRGPTSASGVKVTNALPVSMAFVSAQSSQGNCAQTDRLITCDLGSLTNNGRATVTITARPLIAGLVTNTASVASDATDPVPGNNSAAVQATGNPMAELSILSIVDAPDPVLATSNLTYTILVTNRGPTAADSVQVTDTIPAGLTFVTATPESFTFSQGVVTCNLGTLGIGAATNATITARPALNGMVTNVVAVSSSAFDPLTTNNSAPVVTTVSPLANLTIGMTVSPTTVEVANNVTYTISVTNRGPTSAFGVAVTDPLPAGMAFVSAQSGQGTCTESSGLVTCTLGTLTNNGVVVMTITAAPRVEGAIGNTVSVAASSTDPVPTNNTATAVVSATNNPSAVILQIARSGTNVLLYWSTNFARYSLQSSMGLLAGALWQSVPNAPVVVGNQYFVTNGIESSPRFYRLVSAPPPPTLTADFSGTNVLVSWSTNVTGFLLQVNNQVSQTNSWTTLANNISIQAGRYVYLEPTTNSSRFYRLVKFQ